MTTKSTKDSTVGDVKTENQSGAKGIGVMVITKLSVIKMRWVIRDLINEIDGTPRGQEKVLQESYQELSDGGCTVTKWRDVPVVDERGGE